MRTLGVSLLVFLAVTSALIAQQAWLADRLIGP